MVPRDNHLLRFAHGFVGRRFVSVFAAARRGPQLRMGSRLWRGLIRGIKMRDERDMLSGQIDLRSSRTEIHISFLGTRTQEQFRSLVALLTWPRVLHGPTLGSSRELVSRIAAKLHNRYWQFEFSQATPSLERQVGVLGNTLKHA